MRYRERAKLDKIREKNISKFFYVYKYCDFQNNYNLKDYLFLENCAIAKCQNFTKLGIFFYYFFKDCAIAREQNLTRLEKNIFQNFFIFISIVISKTTII